MFKRKYDIFISYRRKDTSDKAQHLLTILEYNGYFGRVSFDKENLHGRFDVELLNRIDNCTDFIAMISDETFSDVTDEHTELYVKLATCDPKDFYSIIEANDINIIYIQPGHPTQNSIIERFNGSYRRAVLDAYIFKTLNDVREQTEAWMIDYNECRPHESLDNMTPMEYRQKRKAC